MATNYVQRGNTLNFTPAAPVASGSVVVAGHVLGIALTDIPAGAVGALAIEGVFTVPKVAGAVFAVGEALLFDVSAGAFDDSTATPASGDLSGGAIAVRPGLVGETTCLVKLTPGNADLEA